MTNLVAELAQTTEVQTLAKTTERARIDAVKGYPELSFLDNAELALVGGGGAHGGNTLLVE